MAPLGLWSGARLFPLLTPVETARVRLVYTLLFWLSSFPNYVLFTGGQVEFCLKQ